MAKAPVWATLGRLEKKTKKPNHYIYSDFTGIKKLEEIPGFMKKFGKKILEKKIQILSIWKRLEKMWGYQKQYWGEISKICFENEKVLTFLPG